MDLDMDLDMDMDMDALQSEREKLLDLLQDIIVPYREHFAIRFNRSKQFDHRTAATGSVNGNVGWRELNADLRELSVFLEGYGEQESPISPELFDAMQAVAGSLESTIHGSRIRQVIETTKLPNIDNSNSAFVNLESFRMFVLELPKSRQTAINNRPILKNMSVDGCHVLSCRISALSDLLWQQNPQSELTGTASKFTQQRRMRYSSKDFQPDLSRRHRSKELHILLGKYWPCSCGKSHDKMLGSCMDIMLCLQSGWTRLERAFGEFDLLLLDGVVPLHCNVIIQPKSPALDTAPMNNPCQALFDDIRGMKLKIIATQVTTADVTAEFCLDSVSFSEPGSCVTLQKLLDDGIILQLLGGPWLQQYWDGADISFFQFNNDSTPSFNFRQPYLSACWITAQSKTRPGKLHEGYHPMPDMVKLARFLLELELQDTRFSPTLAQDLPSELAKAVRLLQKLKDLDRDLWARALFLESISACLDMETYTGHSPESPHLLLWEIYQKVVNPLEQNLLSLLGPQATMNDLEKELSGASPKTNATLETESNITATQLSPQLTTASDKWFKRLEDETQNLVKPVNGGAVNIAILDTGIDATHPLLRDEIVTKDCWDFVNNSINICDEVGHGTHTAHLLIKTAPRAKIFCGRVWKKRYEVENTGTLVADAIMHAVDKWKANIIVMPFAFPHRNEDIADAVDHASSQKVLLFAAASNNSDTELGFPACLPEVICVYSNKNWTVQSKFCKLGKEKNYNFSIIGEDVEGAWPLCLNNGKETRRQTGTSCSTAIAAGVAALILEYATHKGRYTVGRAKELKKKEFMEKVLFDCMTEGSTSGAYNLIKPWKLFTNYDGKQPRTLQMISDRITAVITGLSRD